MDILKEVRFDVWCPKCQYFQTNENQQPCDDCLANTCRICSEKPEFFKQKEGNS